MWLVSFLSASDLLPHGTFMHGSGHMHRALCSIQAMDRTNFPMVYSLSTCHAWTSYSHAISMLMHEAWVMHVPRMPWRCRPFVRDISGCGRRCVSWSAVPAVLSCHMVISPCNAYRVMSRDGANTTRCIGRKGQQILAYGCRITPSCPIVHVDVNTSLHGRECSLANPVSVSRPFFAT